MPHSVRGSLCGAWLAVAAAAVALLGCSSTPEGAIGADQAGSQSAREREAFGAQSPERSLDYPVYGYRMQVGDKLGIVFFYQSQLNQEVVVRPDGRIALPLAGELQAAGRPPRELEQEIEQRLQGTIKSPQPTVILREFAPPRVFVGGEVKNPGEVSLRSRLTALQAITQVGGPLVTGNLETVVVLRQRAMPTPAFIALDLRGHLKGERANDLALHPNDVVFVPKTRISVVNDLVDQYFEELFEIQRSIGIFYDFSSGFR